MESSAHYLKRLLELLRTETESQPDFDGKDVLVKDIIAAESGEGTPFQAGWKEYDVLCRRKAALANSGAEVAASYESMEEFWADAEAQEEGRSPRSFWDTYEHGRRRQLEAILAETYCSESALLVNTGMSAVEVALAAAGVQNGGAVVVHRHQYFETGDLLREVITARGGRIFEVDATIPGAIAAAAAGPDVAAVLIEPVTNSPTSEVPHLERAAGLPGHVTLIVDNSLFSHSVRWAEVIHHPRLLVVESGIKFLTANCSAGVVYGRTAEVDGVRAYARRTGQQLQERAFNHLQEGELRAAARRTLLHGRNVCVFIESLDPRHWALCRTSQSAAREGAGAMAQALEMSAAGSLIFLAVDGEGIAARHRNIVRDWRVRCADAGIELGIRAGFGWPITSIRSYESAFLNQPDAPEYLRISVGLEEREVIRAMAAKLDEARENTEAIA